MTYEIVTENVSNGSVIRYKRLPNGTCYHEQTPEAVVCALESVRDSELRVRIFYGDVEIGRSWNEENDVIGYIGRSTGRIKVPLLLANSRSMGGGALLDHCIVRIQEGQRVLYEHPGFFCGLMSIEPSNLPGYLEEVLIDGSVHARFKKPGQAERFIEFLLGLRNAK